ncbi:hypothetical protein EAS64_40665 [Trebonia kvetii]|uniref:Uncharacterized protein n=1 Tax=Trebonia kvetii TaxID=2480626 RepID=A0A6P2BLK6_9ACTN|nr:hypothetical protein [Trebonia kvetii]TVY99948.1 hypothetical protein EAS64_40665 [Trebonia kvetii]
MISNSKRNAKMLAAAAAAAAGVVAAACALAAPASAQPAPARTDGFAVRPLHVTRIANGKDLRHRFRPDGKGAARTEALASPDDITQLGKDIFVSFQNGVGPQGEASPVGNLDSTIVEFTLAGREVAQWDLHGKCDGLTADPHLGQVLATVNEDAHSSLYAIAPRAGRVLHYAYSKPLPHNGGTDAISIYRGSILISASAPGTTGAAAPNPKYPAVYVVTLSARTRVAHMRPLFGDEAWARQANGPAAGKTIRLALTDPDSNEVVPAIAASTRATSCSTPRATRS